MEAGKLWGERLKIYLFRDSRQRNHIFRALASFACQETTQGSPSSPTSDPCSSAS